VVVVRGKSSAGGLPDSDDRPGDEIVDPLGGVADLGEHLARVLTEFGSRAGPGQRAGRAQASERPQRLDWIDRKLRTGHTAIVEYMKERNAASLDGLPALDPETLPD